MWKIRYNSVDTLRRNQITKDRHKHHTRSRMEPPSTTTIITIVLAALFATYINSSSPITILLQRPTHTIPPATWHHQSVFNTKSSGPLTDTQINSYLNDGFLILPNFFESYLPALQNDVEQLIDNLAQDLYKAGLVNSLYENSSWTARLLRLTEDYPDAPLVLIKGGVLPFNFQQLYSDAKMLDIANQLGVGPEIAVNAAWNLRAKMKKHEETTVPWHQDNSYWEPRIWDEHVITVWVSLVDATIENGCMQFVKGGHKTGKTARHTVGTTTKTWYTELNEETMVEELFNKDVNFTAQIVTAQVPAGTAIIFPGITPHRSLNSNSDEIRWSTDYRLHPKKSQRKGKGGTLDWFYGLKDSLLLRNNEKNKDYKPDWTSWANVDRTKVQDQGLGSTKVKPFDPVIVGPWMDLWNITTHVNGGKNVHVDRYMASESGKLPAGEGYLPDNW